jgi:beta-mannosidase
MLPEVVSQLDGQRDYWPCSPHNSRWDRKGGNADNGGDAHVWAVWHGRQPFEFYRTCDHRFLSEFGFQSFPEPRTVEGYTREHQRNVTSYVMEHHQRSRIGNTCIMTYMLDWFRMPVGFEQTLWLSQILQGLAISIGVEHWRRNQPRTMGALYWQLNDCWPVASWASIDYHGRWKALQHMARRFFAPVLLSAVEQDDPTKVDLHVTSDLAQDRTAELRRRILELSGQEIAGQRSSLSIPAGSTGKVAEVDLAEAIDQRGKRQVLLAAELVMDDEVVSRQIYTPARPKHLELAPAEFDVRTTRNGDGLDVTVATDVPALYVWLDTAGLDVRLSDNFFHLIPGDERTIRIQSAGEATVADIEEALKIRDLRWTYAGA